VADLPAETRFHGPALLVEHGVISGVSAIIGAPERPYGVLGVHTTRRRDFSQQDVHFVQSVANLLADAIARARAEDALRATLTDLQRSNADLEQFAYVASHDLQEPLRMVTSYVQLLAMRYAGQLDADADEFIGYAAEGAKRMQQLILDLLEYSRVGTHGAAFRPTDATAACQAAIQDLEVAITEAGATVVCDPLPTVLADPSQLRQLFQNLIGNAIKFHGSEPPVVHVSACAKDDVPSTMYDLHTSNIVHQTSNIPNPNGSFPCATTGSAWSRGFSSVSS
jgi:light-regulated signal transduction histidine kinase (bacteriophytochrome)